MGRCECWQRNFLIIGAVILNSFVFNGALGLQFTQEPGNHIAVATQPTWWHCAAHSDQPVTYTWSRGGQPLNGQPNYNVLSNGTLHILSVGQSDVGSYTCQARTSRGEIVTSGEALLTLATLSNSFSANPQSQSLNLGGSASLHCTIASHPQAAISWLFKGGDIAAGTAVTVTTVDSATRSTLTIASLEHRHGGQYRCLGTNRLLPNSAVYSDTATLTLIGRPGFLVTPSPKTVAVGGTASFQCETTGSPSASVQWLNPQSNIIQSSGRFTATSTTLRITNLQTADAGFYTCQATNEWGSNTASALLTVAEAVQPLVFTTTPADKSVAVGSRVTLQCNAVGSPDPVITWSKQGGLLPANRIEEPAPGWLRITGVIATDSGIYVCTASNGLSSISSQAQLIVQVPPSFTASPVDTTARAGESAFFQCQAEGNPAPTITWTTPTTGTLQAPSGPHGGVEVTGEGTLMVSPVERRHAGAYVCTATNSISVISQSATLVVQSPPFFTTVPTDQRVIEGSSTQLTCRAEANPAPTVTWLFHGVPLVNDPKHSVYGNGDLTVRNLEKAQEGTYMCRAENTLGVQEASAFVVVLIPPDFAIYPTDLTVQLGDSVLLDCIGTGDPTPVLQWLKDDQPLVLEWNVAVLANLSLSLSNITKANLGTYTCLATSEAGTNRISAQVWTPDIPFFTVPPTNTTTNESMSATISCQASARKVPTIRWYLADDVGNRGAEVGLGTNLPGSRGAGSFVAADGSLMFSDVSRSDEGLYMCEADNGIGSVAETALLLVNVPPEIVSITSPVTGTETDNHLLLQCIADGRPHPHLTWFLPSGGPVPNDPSRYNVQSSSGYLVIYSPSVKEHDGDFLCRAENFLGNDSTVITVIVQGTPVLTRLLAKRAERSVTLQCLTRGSPTPTHSWSRNGLDISAGLAGHFISSDGSLVIQNLDLAQSGMYECIVGNTFGEVSATFKVPEKPGTPQVTATTSTSIDLAWSSPAPSSNLTVTGYQLQYIRFGEASYQDVALEIVGSFASVTELAPYTGYAFRVRAVNELGPGAFSLVTPFTLTAEAAPSEPQNLLVTSSGDLLIVTWSEPEVLNGNPENIVYQIAYRLRDGEPDRETVLTHEHSNLPYSVILVNVIRNTEYRVRIRAGNTLLGEWSDYVIANAQTLVEAPVKSVTGLKAVALGSSAVRLEWESVDDASFSHYSIAFRQLDSNMSYETVQVTDITANNFTIMGLRENTDYAVKMSYSNAGGQGPYSAEVQVKTELEPLSPGGYSRGGLSSGVVAAIVCGAVAIVLFILILVAIVWQRKRDPAGWIGRKRLNPDALWIHKRYSYGDDHSLDSYPDDSSGNSGQKGTYDVAIVNENYLADDTMASTDSAYDLGGGKSQPAAEEGQKKKKRRKRPRGWSDVIYKSPRNPGVVLVKKAVIGDSDFSPPPVALANRTLDEETPGDKSDAVAKDEAATSPQNGREDDQKDDKDSLDLTQQGGKIPTISAEFPISTDFPVPSKEDEDKVFHAHDAEFLSSTDDDFPMHDPEFLAAHASAAAAAHFPVFPNADDSSPANLAAELNVDSRQMRKMARKTAREQKRREKKEQKEREKEAGSGRSRRRKLSDRIAGKINLRKRGSLSFGQERGGDDGNGGGVLERDYPMMIERQKENAVMF
ncbi:hemicentin-2-like isoform X2 [Acanthaster planci]|nr:hemicentin-2-like isoform X2 [Acanthaster planci]